MPELPMRAILTNLLIIILVVNGIACACPAVADAAASTGHHAAHSGENKQSEAPENCHSSECENDCTALDATKSQRPGHAPSHVRLVDDADDDGGDGGDVMVLARVMETFWPRIRSVAALPLQRTDEIVDSPVTLKVRMLA